MSACPPTDIPPVASGKALFPFYSSRARRRYRLSTLAPRDICGALLRTNCVKKIYRPIGQRRFTTAASARRIVGVASVVMGKIQLQKVANELMFVNV